LEKGGAAKDVLRILRIAGARFLIRLEDLEALGVRHLRLGPLAEQAITPPAVPDHLATADLIALLATTDEEQREQGPNQRGEEEGFHDIKDSHEKRALTTG